VVQHKLGVVYAKGQGVDHSDAKAYAWWDTAAENGHRKSASARDKLATYMSERDLAKAKNIAGEYWRKYVLK
jgi:TPR repeat protein